VHEVVAETILAVARYGSAEEPMSTSSWDSTELFDVDVHQFAGSLSHIPDGLVRDTVKVTKPRQTVPP